MNSSSLKIRQLRRTETGYRVGTQPKAHLIARLGISTCKLISGNLRSPTREMMGMTTLLDVAGNFRFLGGSGAINPFSPSDEW